FGPTNITPLERTQRGSSWGLCELALHPVREPLCARHAVAGRRRTTQFPAICRDVPVPALSEYRSGALASSASTLTPLRHMTIPASRLAKPAEEEFYDRH